MEKLKNNLKTFAKMNLKVHKIHYRKKKIIIQKKLIKFWIPKQDSDMTALIFQG